MNHDCSMARDLMPLCIDGAASEASQRYVEEHVAGCDNCRAQYEQMQTELPRRLAGETTQEQVQFGQMAQMMQKMRRWRFWRNVLVGILIGVVAVSGASAAWYALAVNYNAEYPVKEYKVALSQLQDGRVVVWADYLGSKRQIGVVISGNESMRGVSFQTTILPRYTAQERQNEPLTVIENIDQLKIITVGEDGEIVVWRQGDPIPKASEQMEAFYALDLSLPADSGYLEWLRGEDTWRANGDSEVERSEQLIQQVEALRAQVPEWQ